MFGISFFCFICYNSLWHCCAIIISLFWIDSSFF